MPTSVKTYKNCNKSILLLHCKKKYQNKYKNVWFEHHDRIGFVAICKIEVAMSTVRFQVNQVASP